MVKLKHKLSTLILAVLMVAGASNAFAQSVNFKVGQTFKKDKVYYQVTNLDPAKAMVVIEKENGGYFGDLTIPESVSYDFAEGTKQLSVTAIADKAFFEAGLETLSIPKTIESIGEKAFFMYQGVETIVLDAENKNYCLSDGILFNKDKTTIISHPSEVEFDETKAFPQSLTTIGCGAFAGVDVGFIINIPNTVTSIGDLAFLNNEDLQKVIIPKSVKRLGMAPVLSMGGFIYINIDAENPYYTSKDGAIYNKDLTELCYYPTILIKMLGGVELPNSVTTLGTGAFVGGGVEGDFIIPNTITTIKKYAFYRGEAENIIIPQSVQNIEPMALYLSYETLKVSPDNPNYSSDNIALYNKNQTELISFPAMYESEDTYIIPDGVTTIGEQAFASCEGGLELLLPNTIQTIGKKAFANSQMYVLSLPNSITNIGDSAFYNSFTHKGLYSCIVTPSSVNLGTDVFKGIILGSEHLYIPEGTATAYSSAEQWKLLANPSAIKYPTGITLDPTNKTIGVGDKFKLTATLTDVTEGNALFSIANTTIATIGEENELDVEITAKAVGTTNIIARNLSGQTATCQLTVNTNVDAIFWADGLRYKITQLTPNKEAILCPKNDKPFDDGNYEQEEINIPETVNFGDETFTVVGTDLYVFYDCYNLLSVTISKNIKNIPLDYNAFNSKTLETINVDVNNEYFSSEDGVLFNKNKTTLINYPMGKKGEMYIISDLVNTIKKFAFCESKLTTIYSKIENIQSVTTEEYAFWGLNTKCTLYVPKGKKDKYLNKEQWKDFKEVIEINEEPTDISLNKETLSIKISEVNNTLTATVTENNDPATPVFWQSSNTDVATVNNNGEVKGVGCGTVSIIATNLSGQTATCQVTVTPDLGYEFLANNIKYEVTKLEPLSVGVIRNLDDDDEILYKGNITIPQTVSLNGSNFAVTSILEGAFAGAKYLFAVELPNGIDSIGDEAFVRTNISQVTIPNTVTKIGEAAFGLINISSISIPKSVTNIGRGAFIVCASLKTISVDAENQHYVAENNVLFNAEKTYLMQYPIGNSALHYDIPNTVDSIGVVAFGLAKLTSVNIPNSVTKIGEQAFAASHLDSVNIPNSVTQIQSYTFGESKLRVINIPNSVTTIGEMAFGACEKLQTVNIPNSVKTIEDEAFAECEQLTTIYSSIQTVSGAGAVELGSNVFDVHDDCKVYVPTGTKTAYDEAEQWKELNIVEITYPSSISLAESQELAYGDEFTLNATIEPAEVSEEYKKLIYTSSNKAIAELSVNNGVATVKGVGLGTAVISVQSAYSGIFKNMNVTVNKRQITVTADNISKKENEDDPELTYKVEPKLLEGDEFTGELVREEGEAVGTYAIKQGTLSAGDNYAITFVEGTFTIEKGVGINDNVMNAVSLYPTVVSKGFTVETTENNQTLEIYSLTGAKVLVMQQTNLKQFVDVSSLKSGVYIVKIADKVIKFVKE